MLTTFGGDLLYTIKQHFKLRYFISLTLIIFLLVGCSPAEKTLNESGKITNTTNYNPLSSKFLTEEELKQEPAQKSQNDGAQSQKDVTGIKDGAFNEDTVNEVSVHFIDVGQADSIFIDYGDVDILIDGGNNADGELVVNYLKSLGTDDIELIVATHPHEDHIGGLDTVIYNFDVEQIIKPALSENTKTNRDFEEAISSKSIPVGYPTQGEIIEFGDLKFTVLSDKSKKYSDTNNYSIVLKMVYQETSFLFTGDAEAEAEHDILESGLDIKVDVLKVGHHGSASSTTANFLRKVSPDYAVISVGTDNKYGHPDPIIINRLNLHDIATMQTNEMGTIVFTSNGYELSFTAIKEVGAQNTKVNNKTPTTETEQTTINERPEIVISDLDKKAEFVELTNKSHSNIDLTGWYIVSVAGNQIFYFPDGYILEAGKSIKVASADAVGDIQWSASNIWNNSKSDPAELYNGSGVLVDRWDD